MNKKILVVDDISFIVEFEVMVIESLASELEINIEVDTANTLSDALKQVKENDYDAIIIDINLPDGSGVDIAKAALAKDEKIRIAALTIYPNRFEKDRAYFDSFIEKPILPTAYKQKLRQLLYI